MKPLIIISVLAVTAVVLPSLLFMFSLVSLPSVKWVALIGTIAWFATAPLWIGRGEPDALEKSDPPSI